MSDGRQILQLILDEIKSIRQKVNDSDQRLDNIDKTLIIQEAHLAEHIKRSLTNEKAVEIIKDELKEIQKDTSKYNFILKIIGFILSSGGLVFLIDKYFTK